MDGPPGACPGVMAMGGALSLIADGRADQSLSIFDPASPPAQSIVNLSVLVLAITGFIFVVVEGILVYAIVRFRRRADAGVAEPPQVYGSKPIEIAWTAAPALIVFVLVLVTTRTLWEVKVTPPPPRPGDNALYATVVGRQWWWEYTYDTYDGRPLGFTTANELHVPVGEGGVQRPVYLMLKSADVAHSFWVPRLAGKTDLIPNHPNTMWVEPHETGLYLGQCAQYCGTQHAKMLLRVYVQTRDEFDRWIQEQSRPAQLGGTVSAGQQIFERTSCINCHTIAGTVANGTFGPDLTHLMSRETIAAGAVANTLENLRQWVRDPGVIKPGSKMPAMGLSDPDVNAVVQYLETLR